MAIAFSGLGRVATTIDKDTPQEYYSTVDTCYNELMYNPTDTSLGKMMHPLGFMCTYTDFGDKKKTKTDLIYRFKDCGLEKRDAKKSDSAEKRHNKKGGRVVIIPKPGTATNAEKLASALKTEFNAGGYSVWGMASEAEFEKEILKDNYGIGTYTDAAAGGVTVANQACLAVV